MFAALFIPDFPVEAVVRAEPALREQAVAVVEGKPPLEKVAGANERARALGIEAGMTRLQVEEYGSGIAQRRRSLEQEASTHAALLDAACAFSPRVEDTAPDTVLVDLAGLEALFGPAAKIARDLARRASELGVEANVAVCGDPDSAMYIARGFAGVTIVPPDRTAERLGMLPIEVLAPEAERPQGPDGAPPVERFVEVMERWGIRAFRAFAALPSVAVVERLGQRGLELQKLARGEMRRTLVPLEPPLEFEERVELEHPVENLEPLAFLLNRMLEQLCARLAARSLATNEVRLSCQLDTSVAEEAVEPRRHGDHGGTEIEKPPCTPCLRGENEFARTLRLPVPMQDAKVLLKLLQLDLAAHPPGAPVEKIALRAEPVRPRAVQDGFFVPIAPEPEKLELLLARVAAWVGEENVGAAEVLDSHRPDAHRMKKFGLLTFDGRLKSPSQKSKIKSQKPLALRLFRPPLRAKVETKSGSPSHVAFLQQRGEVIACAGPWRTSGEWWTNDGWRRDEWDVALRAKDDAVVLYRMYRDLSSGDWFVYGSYD